MPKGMVRLEARCEMVRIALESQKRPRPQTTRAMLQQTKRRWRQWCKVIESRQSGCEEDGQENGNERDRPCVDGHGEDLALLDQEIAEPDTGWRFGDGLEVGRELEDRVGAHTGGTDGEEARGDLDAGRGLGANAWERVREKEGV